jgi:hypothetical protein
MGLYHLSAYSISSDDATTNMTMERTWGKKEAGIREVLEQVLHFLLLRL